MRPSLIFLLIALIVSILHLQIFTSSWGDRFEPLALDLWFNIRGAEKPPSDVVVVAMDESSYRVLEVPMAGAWPRSIHAELLKKLSEYGVKRVAMDILFLDHSQDSDADNALAAAFKLNPTVLAAESSKREVATSSGSFVMEELLQPPDLFTESAEQVALARLPDDYGYVRRFTIARSKTTEDIPSLFEAAANINPKDTEKPGPRDFLWYYGPPGTVETFPIHQILNTKGALPKNTFKDKTVFVGLSLRTGLGPDQKDSYRTPFYNQGSMFGVEIQATAAANLISKKWIKRASAWTEASILFVLTLLLTFAIFSLKPHWAGLLIILFSTAWAFASYLSFLSGFFLPGAWLITCFLPLSYLGSTLAYYLVSQRSQQKVEKAFQMYLSPEMAKQMRNNPASLSLGGDSTYATALFTDIEGFTSITEGMTAAETSRMLNAYFTEVMNIVMEKQGTLIKFIGDAVFAIWGAPIKHADHAKLACETALGIQREVEKFNASKRFPALITRIGINTGTMLVGNLGSAKRFDYTAIGDSINLAARLESINKHFGSSILLSESVKKELGSAIKVFALGSIIVSGKKEAVDVFTIFAPSIADSTETLWQGAINKFRLRAWDEALSLFTQASANESRLEKAAKLYINEINRFKSAPPDDNWNGQISFIYK